MGNTVPNLMDACHLTREVTPCSGQVGKCLAQCVAPQPLPARVPVRKKVSPRSKGELCEDIGVNGRAALWLSAAYSSLCARCRLTDVATREPYKERRGVHQPVGAVSGAGSAVTLARVPPTQLRVHRVAKEDLEDVQTLVHCTREVDIPLIEPDAVADRPAGGSDVGLEPDRADAAYHCRSAWVERR